MACFQAFHPFYSPTSMCFQGLLNPFHMLVKLTEDICFQIRRYRNRCLYNTHEKVPSSLSSMTSVCMDGMRLVSEVYA